MQSRPKQSLSLTLSLVAITCILAGGLFGLVTNMINGAISPYYFRKIMHWDFVNINTAVIKLGLIRGLMFGAVFSLIFTAGFGLVTKGMASYAFAMKRFLNTLVFICICWLIGGLFAMLLTSINPDFYRKLFPVTPEERMDMLRFAWVGGSTWGGMIGGLLSAILGVVMLRNRWHQLMNPEE